MRLTNYELQEFKNQIKANTATKKIVRKMIKSKKNERTSNRTRTS